MPRFHPPSGKRERWVLSAAHPGVVNLPDDVGRPPKLRALVQLSHRSTRTRLGGGLRSGIGARRQVTVAWASTWSPDSPP